MILALSYIDDGDIRNGVFNNSGEMEEGGVQLLHNTTEVVVIDLNFREIIGLVGVCDCNNDLFLEV